ncbi:TPA: hypothetical protein H6T47_000258 [Escherichia coli]|uniref:FAD-binding protein n=1 Tax=Escherichia coli TaxID=562 RepID=UPI000BDEEB89|nr:FAD-binding protein [Escherichia coli]HAL6189404.1 hypothetical protein [Escherichia coli]
MKIITCFKLVPEEQDIVVTPEYTLNFDNADAKISQFDLNAIEAASQIATDDDEIAALTIGGSLLQNSKVRKDVLSRGPHSLYLVQDAQLEHALPLDTAKALAAAVEKIGFDLLIFGEGSGDLYAQQVGLLVGEILQLPVINAVSAIQRQGNTLVIERTLEDEVGCSRPIAEGENWMERERYIGVSGVLLKSDLYLTLGISGQIQHMVGGNGAKVIVAINKDKNAPIFNYADYGLVGDIYKVVPALISQLSR